MKNISKVRGFTLIELMVVIAIIGILSAVVMASMQTSRAKARDGKRISDIAQLQLALEQYFDRKGYYPPVLSSLSPDYISTLPRDPSTGLDYDYVLNGPVYDECSDYSDYFLHGTFESPNASVLDGLSVTPYVAPNTDSTVCGGSAGHLIYTAKRIVCSNASGSLEYCVGPK